MDNFQIIKPSDCRECLSHPSKVIETAKGRIEYAERGKGPVLMSVHGSPGGYDQGLGLGEIFRLTHIFHERISAYEICALAATIFSQSFGAA